MTSGHQSFFVTTSLAQSVFQLCGAAGIQPFSSVTREDWTNVVMAAMPDPMQYNTAEGFAKAYLSYSLLRKFDSFPIPLDRRAAASCDFDNSEVSCGRINSTVGALPYVPGVPLARQQQCNVEIARSLIKRCLGSFDWEELQMACDFSSGSSTRVPRKRGNAVFKLDGRPHVTIGCRDLAVHFIWCNEFWRKFCQEKFGRESDPYSWVELVIGSRFDTVPKDSQKDRPICVEPDLNMFFQKGIGSMIRRRLYRCGINLNDQTLNQRLARQGSIHGDLATIDLSGASDSVSLAVCEMLLPQSWYEAMLMTRSPYVLKDGKWVRLEKISSMGNGFTFELESLIFWALAKAVSVNSGSGGASVSVYGDDIIVPGACARELIDLLSLLGFATNASKTFVDGPFRESCGKHYFLGADVTPFKIESPIETWSDIYHFVNRLRSWSWGDPTSTEEIVRSALRAIPPRNRCYVPESYGTRAGLVVATPPRGAVRFNHGTRVFKFSYLRRSTKDHDLTGPCAYLAAMLLREQRVPSGPLTGTDSDYGTLSRVGNSWVRCTASTSDWC